MILAKSDEMKTFVQVSVFIPCENSRRVIRKIKELVDRYTANVLAIKKITHSNTNTTYVEEDDARKTLGFWVNIDSDAPGVAGVVGSFVEDLSRSGFARYYELVVDYSCNPDPKIRKNAFTLALRGLSDSEPSSGK